MHIDTISKSQFFILLILAIIGPSRALAQNPELVELISRHQATVAGMNTLQLQLRVRYDPIPTEGVETIHYWRHAGDFRLKTLSESGRENEYSAKDGTIRAYNYLPSMKGSVATKSGRIQSEGGPIYGDPMVLCLFAVPGSNKFHVPLATLMEESHHFSGIRQVSEHGRDYSVFEIRHDRAKMEVWLSKRHNYLVGKLVTWDLKGSKYPIGTSVVEQFNEVRPGVYFPVKINNTKFDIKNGNAIVNRSLVVERALINHPLDKKVLNFQFPADLMVMDMIQGKVWTTNTQGELASERRDQNGQIINLAKGPPGALTGDSISNPPPIPAGKTATLEEPASSTRWILPISLALIFCGCSLMTFQKWREKHTA